MVYSGQGRRQHFRVGLAAVAEVSAADWGWLPPAQPRCPLPGGTAGDTVATAHRWGTAPTPGTGHTGFCASTKKERGLLGVSGYGAVLGRYCKLRTVRLYLFVLSGINYALQMLTKSFVAWLHEGRINSYSRRCQVLPGLGWSPGRAGTGWGLDSLWEEAAAAPT